MASTVDAKLLKQTKFPPEFNQKVDMKKVNLEVMKKWIAGRISEILGNEDDVVIELCFNLLEGTRFPEIKKLQIQLTGFLEKDTARFCKELWSLCLSAQSNAQGVPKELLEAKKLELIQEKIDAEKAVDEVERRKQQETRREKDVEGIRQRERGERRGGGEGRRGGRGGRGFDTRGPPRMDSRSPPRRRGSPPMDNYRPRPAVDTYVPPTSHRYRRRSPSVRRSTSRLRSRSNGPSRRRREKAEESRFSRRPRSISSSPGRGHRSRYNRDERRRSPVHRNGRRRSYTPSDTSRSRSPRRYRRTRSSSRSPSRSSSVQSTRRRFVDMSSPLSKDNNEHNAPSSSSRHHGSKSDANGLKDSAPSPRPQSPDIYREMDRGRPKTYSRRHRSPSSSHSRSRDRARKRRRSLQRYEPVARRRRNTSSKSSSGELRRKRAHVSDDEDPRSHRR